MLRDRIGRRYDAISETVVIGDLQIPFTRIRNPDDMVAHMEMNDGAGGESTPRWQPYWAANWDAAWAVADELSRLPLDGKLLLDLGCGLGLTGIVACARGARVWMVDAAQPSLLFARLNTWPWRQRVRIRRVDWRRDLLPERRFDLIVGSDIIYDREDWPYLDDFWKNHLAPRGRLLLGESGRRTGELFPGWLTARGWRVQAATQSLPQCARPQRIFWAQRTAKASETG